MKIYVDFVLEKHYTNRFSDTSAKVFVISQSDGESLCNETIVIDYLNSSAEEGLVFVDNPLPKEHITSLYLKGGKLYMESINNQYEIQGITIV